MTESPTKVPITSENQSNKAATNRRVNTVAEQVNILVACSETHTRKLDNLTKILKAVAVKNGVSVDILNDVPDMENLWPRPSKTCTNVPHPHPQPVCD